ncbi:MAG: hypothetical protein MZV70_05130 [Desulfobacterales bacterium]|nr:hypothetical protein [Desulfobacterales bacterium]
MDIKSENTTLSFRPEGLRADPDRQRRPAAAPKYARTAVLSLFSPQRHQGDGGDQGPALGLCGGAAAELA